MNDIRAVVGVDIAKHVFQLHEVSRETGEISSIQLKRKAFLAHFANRSACLIGMEACGGAQHWARKLAALGHDVRLLPALQVKAFACGNKNDTADARAIWMAVQQPGVRTAAIKTEAQQAVLAMHRVRQQLIKFRTAQINALRGLLTEYGEVMPRGRSGIARRLPGIFANLVDRLRATGSSDVDFSAATSGTRPFSRATVFCCAIRRTDCARASPTDITAPHPDAPTDKA